MTTGWYPTLASVFVIIAPDDIMAVMMSRSAPDSFNLSAWVVNALSVTS